MSIISDAIAKAKATTQFTPGMCAYFTGKCYGQQSTGYSSAATQWAAIPDQYKHPGDQNPPPGAVCYYLGGSHGYGHAAISVGGGKIRSTDMNANGYYHEGTVNTVDINAPSHWGYGQHYVGWAHPYFHGTLLATVPTPSTPTLPVVSLGHLVGAAQTDAPGKGTPKRFPADTVRVEQALASEGLLPKALVDGSFGTSTVLAYKAWQRKAGVEATGTPDLNSLTKLGAKYGFRAAK